jgi:hypothetical protein
MACAFVIMGAPRVWEAIRERSFGPIQPYHTTNSYAVALLKVHHGSERLIQVFSALPPTRPIAVILLDGNDESIFVGSLVSYFGWPREMRSVPVRRANAARQLQSLDRASLAAIFFCGIDPPAAMPPVIRIGSGLVMVPTAATPEASVP